MSTATADTIGFGPADTTTPPGTLFAGSPVSGYIGFLDGSDAYEIVLTKDVDYTFDIKITSPLDDFGRFSSARLVLQQADSEAFLGVRLISKVSTNTSEPTASFEYTPSETGAFYLSAVTAFAGYPDAVAYTLSAVKGEPAPEPPVTTNLPPLVAPDAASIERSIYTGLRQDDTTVSIWFAPDGDYQSKGWDAIGIAAALEATARWSQVADLTFSLADSDAEADLIFSTKPGLTDGNGGPALGATNFPKGGQEVLYFNSSAPSWSDAGLQPGGNGFDTLVHEIGHVLGLAHPHLAEENSTILAGVVDEQDRGDFALNQAVHSVLSYVFNYADVALPEGQDRGYIAGPMAIDIAVAQRLYGARASATGDDTYTLAGTSAPGTGYRAIHDSGGTDTIRAEGVSRAVIDLRAATLLSEVGGGGRVSHVVDLPAGLTIAHGTVIENASGAGGNDSITGNAQDNTLVGGGGKDTLAGLDGADTLRGGAKSDILIGGIGDDTLLGGKGRDTISYADATGEIEVSVLLGTVTGQQTDTFASIERFVGSEFDDTMQAYDKTVLFKGAAGDDFLIGSTKRDKLVGGIGEDALFGDDGSDVIQGGRNDDVISGDGDRDKLSGGGGGDVFVYRDASDSGTKRKTMDVITDFDADDYISLGSLNDVGSDTGDVFTVIGGNHFSGDGTGAEVLVVERRTAFFVLVDIDGDGVRDLGIKVRGLVPGEADFFL